MKKSELDLFFEEKRKDFPILKQKVSGCDLIYVDNGATTQKPKKVIDAVHDYYCSYNSNVHRGLHTLSQKATETYEGVRRKVASFINCSDDEVIFTSGTTMSLNMVANGFEHILNNGDEIVLSAMEHHANLVPWQEVAKRCGAVLKFIPYDHDFRLDLDEAKKLITSKTKIVSITHVSNVLGTLNPVAEIGRLAHDVGALFVVDGAQSVPHMKIDVKAIGCDLFAFSAHKMCGPCGVGVLYGKKDVLEKMKPSVFGGDMINEVEFKSSSYNRVPYRFEAGTPNIEGVIGFGAALDYLSEIGMKKIEKYEHELCEYFLKRVKEVEGLKIYGSLNPVHRAAVFSFNIEGVHSHDMSTILDMKGIATRGGHHCCMPLMGLLGTCATSRVSLYFYNTKDEIDKIIDALKSAKENYDKGSFL